MFKKHQRKISLFVNFVSFFSNSRNENKSQKLFYYYTNTLGKMKINESIEIIYNGDNTAYINVLDNKTKIPPALLRDCGFIICHDGFFLVHYCFQGLYNNLERFVTEYCKLLNNEKNK